MKETTAQRINQMLIEKNWRQVDLIERAKPLCTKYNVKMNRSDVSQYLSGRSVPSQEKLVVLASVLGVSEAWLMGFDVAKYKTTKFGEDDVAYEYMTKLSALSEADRAIIYNLIDSMSTKR